MDPLLLLRSLSLWTVDFESQLLVTVEEQSKMWRRGSSTSVCVDVGADGDDEWEREQMRWVRS
jgi:hypothetical protein